MARIKLIINIPENGCEDCSHLIKVGGGSIRANRFITKRQMGFCKLFGNEPLEYKDGKIERCSACRSCEIKE